MQEMIFVIDKKNEGALSEVRCIEGLYAATDNENILLKCAINITNENSGIVELPVKKTFLLDDERQLFEKKSDTPVDVLKEYNWQPLSEFLKIELPVFAMPAKVTGKYTFKIIPASNSANGSALLTALAIFKKYAEEAPAIRLQSLTFAASEKNEVLIKGNPLPPLPGKEYWESYD